MLQGTTGVMGLTRQEAAIGAADPLEDSMTALPPSRVAISSPDAFLAAVPHLLGFPPEQSIVLTGLATTPTGRDEITLVQRFDIPPSSWSHEQLVEVSRNAMVPMVRAGSDTVIVAVFSDAAPNTEVDLPQRALVDELIGAADDTGLGIRDALYTDGTTRWSYGCTDPTCCPPTGRVIPEQVRTLIAAEFTAAGAAMVSSRDALTDELTPTDPQRPGRIAALVTAAPTGTDALEAWRDERIYRVHTVLADRVPPTDLDCADVISALEDIRVRDTVLWDLTQSPGDAHRACTQLTDITRHAPAGHRAPVATVLGLQQWMTGDGARARIALDHALRDQPDYSLAGLADASVNAGLPPATWRDLMSAMPREHCRHGQTTNSTSAPGQRAAAPAPAATGPQTRHAATRAPGLAS